MRGFTVHSHALGQPVVDARSPAKGRIAWYDNARWLAGSLVVAIHMTSPHLYGGTPGARGGITDWFHSVAYPMRIPLFSLLVGFFTPVLPTSKDFEKLLRYVVIPFALVTFLHVLWGIYVKGEVKFDPTVAAYTLWFMFAVLIWRVAGPYLWRFKYPLVLSIIVSLFMGQFSSLSVFRLSIVFGMMPFFVMGMKLRHERNWLEARSPRRTRAAVLIVVGWVVLITALFLTANIRRAALAMVGSYQGDSLAETMYGMGERLLILALGGATMLAVLYLTPRKRIPFISYIGAGGFTIYLLHGLVLTVMWYFTGPIPSKDAFRWWMFPGLLLASFALAALLGSRPVRWLAKPIVRPNLSWLYRKDAESQGT